MFQSSIHSDTSPSTDAAATTTAPRNNKTSKRARERDAALEFNPFLAEMKVSLRKKRTKVLEHRISEDADGAMGHEFAEIAYVDKAEFVKVLTKGFRACFDLGAAGARVFWLVMAELSENQEKDLIFLSYRKPFTISGQAVELAKSTFYDGLKQLTTAGFIAPAAQGPGFYWINPERFFNGNRATFIRQYRLKAPYEAPKPQLNYPQRREGGYYFPEG